LSPRSHGEKVLKVKQIRGKLESDQDAQSEYLEEVEEESKEEGRKPISVNESALDTI
jgi:hypothetical protein